MSSPIVIIGSGLAAYTLAREFRKLDAAAPLTLVSRDGGGFYSKPMLSNAWSANKSPASLVMKSAEQMAEELRATIITRSSVAAILPKEGAIRLEGGSRLPYRDLVLALGADPVRLPLQGDAAEAVMSVNDLDDFARFSQQLDGAKTVAILGAGLIGCEFANDLLSRGIRPVVIDPAAWPLSRLLPAAAGQRLAEELGKAGVDFRWGVTARTVDQAARGFCLGLSDGSQVEADVVLSAVGLRPRTDLAAAAGAVCRCGIVTGRDLATSLPKVHALGDCAEVAGISLPFVLPIMHQARALARSLAGSPAEVSYPAMPVVVKTPACPTVVCPPPPTAAGEWRVEARPEAMTVSFRDAGGKLLGFALLGVATRQRQALAAEIPPLLA